ncbi:hypothetical protein F4677DRAFT_403274 [Hypoxylon crocopeplum]|nr:hypothetical protein F4677DRAFT_403274 [Hypoxylon crocopeplum]
MPFPILPYPTVICLLQTLARRTGDDYKKNCMYHLRFCYSALELGSMYIYTCICSPIGYVAFVPHVPWQALEARAHLISSREGSVETPDPSLTGLDLYPGPQNMLY